MIYNQVYKMHLFCLTEKYGNFAEAASHAGITRSALSQNLTSLEDYFKQSLLIREKGSVRVTPNGKIILKKVRDALALVAELDYLSQPEMSLTSKIRIGAYESIAVSFFPSLFQNFNTIYPDVKFDIITSRSDSLSKLVNNGSLDLALVINGVETSKTEVIDLATDYLGVFASADKFLGINNLAEVPDIGLATLSTPSDGVPLYYKKFISQFPEDNSKTLTSDSFESIRSLAASGIMLGVLPSRVAYRKPNELKELWPKNAEIAKKSEHKLSLVFRRNTDSKIIDLITRTAQRTL